ncbi:LAME_0B04368g1_1 [Lachancea meyersii CBS 8951]|uniref:LAME_0B04368g1_1 n=1 Tax=Lachancea meyersii CBS 8951 TaxID=1266667 RepID=A0A1G4IVA7_9SACH|nr:LAME_0B04368g1_1 [Lachancea meyersii CBS 8951]
MVSQELSSLLTWGSENGITYPSEVQFLKTPDRGISAIATTNLAQAVFQVPKDAIIHGKLAEAYFGCEVNSNTLLKLLLAKLKFDSSPTVVDSEDLKSKFGPYISALPKDVSSPLIWNPKELDHLGNTNVRTSITAKLKSMFLEWENAVLQLDDLKSKVQEEITHVRDVLAQGEEQIYTQITSKPFDIERQFSWWSFPAFLWSSLIFLSRAFPEIVVDANVDPSRIVLLPIIDLLNHNTNSRVEWRKSEGSFCVEILEAVEKDCEIFNNYGGKGNEELLCGYGFVLENNVCDTVALKIKLPPTALLQVADEKSIRLPTIADYTRSAFDPLTAKPDSSQDEPITSKYKDGILYLLSATSNTCLTWLLDLFAFLEKTDGECLMSLRPRMQGLQSLRAALEAKYRTYKAGTTYSNDEDYTVSEYRAHLARVYKSGQIKVVKNSISELKRIEKDWTLKHKDNTLSVNKLMRMDSGFMETELPEFLQLDQDSDIALDSYDTLMCLWILCKLENQSAPEPLQWAVTQYTDFLKARQGQSVQISENIQTLHQTLFPKDTRKTKLRELKTAVAFITANCYTRYSKDEPILVKMADL